MGKKKSWFTYVTRLFISEPKAVKKWKNSRSLFKSKCYLAIENPSTALNDPAEQERGKHAVAIATAAVAAAEAAIAAANAAAEVARITNLSHELRRKNLHSAAIKIQSYYKGYLARKALSALKGVMKLQAVVRGELARTRMIKKLARISPRELRLQRSRIIQENSTPATIGTTKLAQLKLRNAIKHAQNEDSTPPFTHGRRSFCHVNDRSAGNGDYNDGYNNLSLNKAQAFPAYMATTESAKAKAKAKARSSSTPKQRRRLSDSYSCQDSPSNLSISSWSSFNSELIQHSKSVIANGTRRL